MSNCVLMVVSPTSIYSYWNISPLIKKVVEFQFNSDWVYFKKIIRLYEITEDAPCYLEYQLQEESKQWFFNGLLPNRTFRVEIGVTTESGFFAILRSNDVLTPRGIGENEKKWIIDRSHPPKWVDAFSSYSYYEKK